MNRNADYLADHTAMTSPIKKYGALGGRGLEHWVRLVLAAICVSVAVYCTQRLDIGLYDETAYLQRGAAIDEAGSPTADMGPVYSMWYRVLQVFWSDPVDRYFASLGITIALFPFALFMVLRRLGTSLTASLVVTLFVLVSTLNVLNWPRVSVFALIILLAGLWSQAGARSLDRGWAYLLCSVLIAVYVRPELALSVAGIGVLWIIDLMGRKRRREPYSFVPFGVSVMVGIALTLGLGSPFGHGRGMVAFGQHYALNRIEADDDANDAWTSWETIAARELGTTSNLSTAMGHAPDRIAWHIGRNLRQMAPTIGRMVLPAGARLDRKAALLLGLLFGALCWAMISRQRGERSSSIPLPWIIAALSAPAILAAIIIHPRQHYLLFPLALAIIPLMAALFPDRSDDLPWPQRTLAAIAVAIIVLFLGRPLGTPGRPVLTTIHALRELDLPAPLVILDADGGYATYLPAGSVRIPAQDKDLGLYDHLRLHHINVIVASPRLERDPRFAADPEWRRFVTGGYTTGFDRISVAGTSTTLYIARPRSF